MSYATSAQMAYTMGLGPAGVKLFHDIANAIFGSTTEDTDAYRWAFDPKLDQPLVMDRGCRRRFYWEWLPSGELAVINHETGHRTVHAADSRPAQVIPKKATKPTHRPSMPPPSAVREDLRDIYSVLKQFAEAVCGSDAALEYHWGIDRKFPGQLCVQVEGTGKWRRVELRDDGSFAIHCEYSGEEYILPATHEVTKLMTEERSENGRRLKSHFDHWLAVAKERGMYRPTLQ